MIYLASPYSHPQFNIRYQRFIQVCESAARLMNKGIELFCPIAHNHPILLASVTTSASDKMLAHSWEKWAKYDRWFVERCDAMAIIMLEGWDLSTGIKAEVEIAKSKDIPVARVRYKHEYDDLMTSGQIRDSGRLKEHIDKYDSLSRFINCADM